MQKIAVLGAGLVGAAVARDLSTAFDVTAVDRRGDELERVFAGTPVDVLAADLSEAETVRSIVAPFDLVVGALPGHLGYRALASVIEAGKSVVDIAFFPEDPFELDERARARGVTAVVDFGVAPGMSHVLLGHHVASMDAVRRFECLVGGLPVERRWPFDYKAPFSPADVLEEYTRPARYVEHGTLVERPALSDPERIEVDGVGTLESLNTDGLRTLLRTTQVPNMKEKTLRYPGHGRLMEALRAGGFFSTTPLAVGGVSVRPLDVTSALLFPQWTLRDGEAEFTYMRVTVEGTVNGRDEQVVWELLDRGDAADGRDLDGPDDGLRLRGVRAPPRPGRVREPGISPPEQVAADPEVFAFLLAYQRERGVRYERRSG